MAGGSYTYIQDGMLIPHKFPDRIGEGSLYPVMGSGR